MKMKTMSQVLKAMLLSFVLTSFAPSVLLASVNGISAVQEGDTEDLEAVKHRLMDEIDYIYKRLYDLLSWTEQILVGDFSENNAPVLKDEIIQKATELRSLGGSSLENDMSAIIDAVSNSNSEEMMRISYDLRGLQYELEELIQMVYEASTMEQLVELEEKIEYIRKYFYDTECIVLDFYERTNEDEVTSFNTKNVGRYFETMWKYATELNYQLFKDGDLFVAKGFIFKVLDAEKKTCQLGRGEGSWWPKDYRAAQELSNSDCFSIVKGDYPPGTSGNYLDKKKITLPDQVLGFTLTVVGEAAFNQQSLNLVELNESLEEIGKNAFESYGFSEIYITKNVKKIGKFAFSNFRANMTRFEVDAQNLIFAHTPDYKGVVETATNTLVAACEDITIPESVKVLGEGVFYDCNFETIVLPQNLQTISRQAFQYCENMKSIDLPENLKEIGESAFSQCLLLGTIRVNWSQPIEIPENVFDTEHYEGAALYVPKGLRELYASTPGWSKFKKILEEGEVDLDPFQGYKKETKPEDVKEVEDLSGVVINDIYYSMNTESGDGYDEATNSLVFNSTLPETGEAELDNTAVLPEDFYGICFMVPAGGGRIAIDVETAGSRTIGVKIGNKAPRRYSSPDRQTITVEYSVSSPSYVYIYPSNKDATARSRGAESADKVKIYSFTWTADDSISDPEKIDFNEDGEMNVTDVVTLISCIAKNDFTSVSKEAADVNGDGEVNVTDVVTLIIMIGTAN